MKIHMSSDFPLHNSGDFTVLQKNFKDAFESGRKDLYIFLRNDLDIFDLLGVCNDVTEEQFSKEFKLYAKKNHPDKGGNVQGMQLLTGAADYFLKEDKGDENFAAFKAQRKTALEQKHRKEALDAEAKFSYSIGSKVTIQGIKSKPEYNGLKGTVKSFNEEKGRFLVEIEGG